MPETCAAFNLPKGSLESQTGVSTFQVAAASLTMMPIHKQKFAQCICEAEDLPYNMLHCPLYYASRYKFGAAIRQPDCMHMLAAWKRKVVSDVSNP